MKIITLFYILIFKSVIFCNSAAAKELVFCYEDKDVAPMFLGVGQEIPIEQPDASVEILRLLDKVIDDVEIKFVQKPWRRCLNDLEFNRVNAVIASYRIGRESFAVYPMGEDAQPNTNFAVSKFDSCLIGRYKFRKEWESREVFQTKAFTIAVPNGYGLSDALKKEPFFVHNTFSKDKAFELLEKGVVDASVDLCQVGDTKTSSYPYKKNEVSPIYPPYESTYGYLAFSHAFYKENPKLSAKMWQWLSKYDSASIYIDHIKATKK